MKKYKTVIFCFSPQVMLATFALETILAVYALWRYKWDNVTRLTAALLVFLAIFQLAEYMICEAIGLNSLNWAKIGYVAITLLPPLGIHLAYEISGVKKRPLLWPAYIAAAAFTVFFVLVGQSIQSQACLGNYVIFSMTPSSGWLYAVYYYGLVVGGMLLCAALAKKANASKKRALTLLAVGYGVFLLPTTTVNLLEPSTIAGIPSIMCGFAVIFAVILSIWILPLVGNKK